MACPRLGVRRPALGRRGAKPGGKAQGRPVPSGRPQAREDRTGELLEPSLMPREARTLSMGSVAGCRDWPLRSGRCRSRRRLGRGEHRRPRGREGTHPGRSSCVRNSVTPSRSGRDRASGKPTARRAQPLGGESDDREANAGSRKATGNRDAMTSSSNWSPRMTGRIPGLVPGRESALTRSGEPIRRR